ncbi:RNA polymerase sigma-70 factor, ECF subfamily [Ruminococcaceae bacterium FB2012]|nr:RNA polymerase sigma-70 factor, ECF subfamily [Ruminococcaceae bacterium FB2012]
MKKELRSEDISDFYQAHYTAVFRLCMSFMKNEQEAADAAEETFLRWLERSGDPGDGRYGEAWLIVTAGNYCRDLLRRRKRFGREDISSAYELTAPDTSHRDRELWSAVTDLPDKYKTVLFLYYYKDMTVEEIAKAAGIRRGTVRSQLSRARQLLRQALGGDFDE